jgi:hypothetical protein
MGIDVNSYMAREKYFITESDLFDAIESIASNLSITTELEKTDREQIEKLSLRIEDLDNELQLTREAIPMEWWRAMLMGGIGAITGIGTWELLKYIERRFL